DLSARSSPADRCTRVHYKGGAACDQQHSRSAARFDGTSWAARYQKRRRVGTSGLTVGCRSSPHAFSPVSPQRCALIQLPSINRMVEVWNLETAPIGEFVPDFDLSRFLPPT